MAAWNRARPPQNHGVGPTPEEKKAATIDERQKTQKEQFLVFIAQGFVIAAACQKAGISRATYYRWREDDPGFAKGVEEMQRQGDDVIYDRAMANIVQAIKDGNLQASRMYIDWYRKKYAPTDECTRPHITFVMDL